MRAIAPVVGVNNYTVQHDREAGGRWRPVNGTVTIEGDPQTLQTFTATPHLEG